MDNKVKRHPIRHFFIKRSMQYGIIFKIFITVFITSIITTLILAIIYTMKSQGGNFYFMSNDIMQDLELKSMLGIVLPALVFAQIVGLLIAFLIGLFSSRKAAVPVYKLEKWAKQLKNGKLNTHIGFRETEQMKELTIQCNAFTDRYRQVFFDIEKSLKIIGKDNIYKSQAVNEELQKIEDTLKKIEYK